MSAGHWGAPPTWGCGLPYPLGRQGKASGQLSGRPPVIADDMLHTVLRRRAGWRREKAQAYPEAVETAHADFATLQQRDRSLKQLLSAARHLAAAIREQGLSP